MASSLTVTNDFDKLGNNMRGEEVIPVSVASRWYDAVAAGGPATLDAATVTNPDTQITDSTDYYRRQENTAAFARLTGLTQLSATIADQLMEENTSFRMRWTKVMAAGI